MDKQSVIYRAARAVAIASDAETAARATEEGYEPFVDEQDIAIARAVLSAIMVPSDKMVKAAEAWNLHCSDRDSMWSQMVSAALHPDDYAGEDKPFVG